MLRAWGRRLLLLALALIIVLALARIFRTVDIHAVGAALAHLSWWQVVLLIGLLLVRQVLAAMPLSTFIPAVTLPRATINDLAACTASAFAPPPSDMVLRVSIFSSWGIPVPVALAGTTANTMTLFIVRFGIPLAGFVIAIVTGAQLGVRLLDIASLLVSAALIAGLLLVARAETLATKIGRSVGRFARRVRRGTDPDTVAASFGEFQRSISDGFSRRFTIAMISTIGAVFVDLVILTLAMRFVGIGSDRIGLLAIAAAFFFAYPLTLFPMQGTGVLDAVFAAGVLAATGPAISEQLLAALLIWRALTIAGPFLLGLGALVVWKATLRRRRAAC